MLENCDIKERWSGVDTLIARWLQDRQRVIVDFCAISGVQALAPQTTGSRQTRLQTFCEHLLDYVSSGHFEVYYELLREAEEFSDGSAERACALLPAITSTTQGVLDFNDCYAEGTPREGVEPGLLAKDLSHLGELLAERFEYEDRLIAELHAVHREMVA